MGGTFRISNKILFLLMVKYILLKCFIYTIKVFYTGPRVLYTLIYTYFFQKKFIYTIKVFYIGPRELNSIARTLHNLCRGRGLNPGHHTFPHLIV